MKHFFLISAFFLVLTGCGAPPASVKISGSTMGTTYNIVVVDHSGDLDEAVLQKSVDAALEKVNSQFSNWDAESEVSRFNTATSDSPFPVSADFLDIMAISNNVHVRTKGYFDVTLGPVVELWGFSKPGPDMEIPSDDRIAAAMNKVGQSKVISVQNDASTITKNDPDATIYLAAVAKGYGIDEVAKAISSLGYTDYMVEIGGDLITNGKNQRGEAWRIGIEQPDSLSRSIQKIVDVSGVGMATSGDYRIYFEQDGVRYSHIIDIDTGRPITHKTASVTVMAETAALADAWATALLALGSERGLSIAEANNISAMFIDRTGSGAELEFTTLSTTDFQQ